MESEANLISADNEVVSIMSAITPKFSSILQPGESQPDHAVVVVVDGFGMLDGSEDSLNDQLMVSRYTFKNMNRMTVQVYINAMCGPHSVMLHDLSVGYHVWCHNNKHSSSRWEWSCRGCIIGIR